MACHPYRKVLSIEMILRDTVFTVFLNTGVAFSHKNYFFAVEGVELALSMDLTISKFGVCTGMKDRKT